MKLRALSLLLLTCIAGSISSAQTAAPEKKFSPPARKFRFTYSFTVKDIPSGSKLVRVWVPVAHTDEHQTVRLLEREGSGADPDGREESEYGNHILYAEIHNPAQSTAEFTLEYEVTRREFSRGDYAQLELKDTKPGVVPARCSASSSPTS